MANVSLGKVIVPSAGTPVQVTINEADPTAPLLAHAVLIQPLPTNTGRIYVGNISTFVKSGAGQIAWLPAPGTNVAPSFSETVSYAQNSVDLTELYVDVDNTNEGVIVSGIVI